MSTAELAPHCRLEAGHGGLPVVRITNDHADAEVYLNGATVTHYRPRHAAHPILWTSAASNWEAGTPIRGGIPLCWPWFADTGPADSPAHGLARIATWRVEGATTLAAGDTRLSLALDESLVDRSQWPHPFQLRLLVTVGQTLDVALQIRHQGDAPVTWTGALHTYFAVSDARQVRVQGLDGRTFVDRMAGDAEKTQVGAICFSEETDRIYADAGPTTWIEDNAWQRRIRITKRGSGSTVVWNPWIAKSARMPDFGDDEWPHMCCVETARAAFDACTLNPGERHELGVTIGLE